MTKTTVYAVYETADGERKELSVSFDGQHEEQYTQKALSLLPDSALLEELSYSEFTWLSEDNQ